jgi:PTH1 family peptidyl-tRNA hydrolase
LKIGIGRPEHGNITGHVLNRFGPDEQKLLPQLLDTAADAVEKILRDGVVEAMSSFNNYNLYD